MRVFDLEKFSEILRHGITAEPLRILRAFVSIPSSKRVIAVDRERESLGLVAMVKGHSHGGTPNSWMIYRGKSWNIPLNMDDFVLQFQETPKFMAG